MPQPPFPKEKKLYFNYHVKYKKLKYLKMVGRNPEKNILNNCASSAP